MKPYLYITVFFFCSICHAQSLVTLITQKGEKFENVKIASNTPDLVIVTSPKGLFTIAKSQLTLESQKIVGYNPASAQQEIAKKNAETADYIQYLAQQEKEKQAAAEKSQQLQQANAIAAAESARLQQIRAAQEYAAQQAEQQRIAAAQQAAAAQAAAARQAARQQVELANQMQIIQSRLWQLQASIDFGY